MVSDAWIGGAAMGAVIAASLHGPVSARDWAGQALGPQVTAPASGGAITTDDLLRLRDLGGLSLSPDGRWLAFSVREGDAATDRYVQRWFVAPSDGHAAPTPLKVDGGQPIRTTAYGVRDGYIPPDPARWSPDSRRFAFRRAMGRRVELWVAELRGRGPVRVADGTAQVDAFGWLADGALVYRTGLDARRYERALDVESGNGWLQDGRVAPFASRQRPAPPNCAQAPAEVGCAVRTYVWTPERVSRIATEAERTAYEAVVDLGRLVPDAQSRRIGLTSASRTDGALAWLEAADPAHRDAILPLQRVATNAQGARDCGDLACAGGLFRGLGWAREGDTVWFLRGESGVGRADGAPYDLTTLYEWAPRSGVVRRILGGEALLSDCQAAGATLYCVRATATQPPRIVAVDLDRGTVRVLCDPNPQFASKVFPRVRRLRLEGAAGAPGFADLVYPNGYEPGRRYPLVIVQYVSKGFLRGGVGNEVPIFPLAAQGFVVLSLDRPMFWDEEHTLTKAAFDRFLYEDDLRDRRNVMKAIDGAIDKLVSEGVVDPSRVAITGLSSGAEVVHYALQTSNRFAAAIASSGAHDLTFLPLMPASSERVRRQSMFESPSLVPPPGNALYQLAWSQRPSQLRAPLLINAGEHEAMLGFEGLETLKQAHRPLEVRVFPDEFHTKYHPRSLAGVYENNVNWLRFWLLGEENPNPRFAAEYLRWRAMRDHLRAEVASPRLAER